jgi:hypothetical protein
MMPDGDRAKSLQEEGRESQRDRREEARVYARTNVPAGFWIQTMSGQVDNKIHIRDDGMSPRPGHLYTPPPEGTYVALCGYKNYGPGSDYPRTPSVESICAVCARAFYRKEMFNDRP